MAPDFPIRIIFDDGEVVVIDSPDELVAVIDSIDTTDPRGRAWARDERDRTVRLRIRNGIVDELEV